jgi:hypothetical protein
MRSDRERQHEWIELNLTRGLAVLAQGAGAIRAAVILVLWITALGFFYLLWRAQGH